VCELPSFPFHFRKGGKLIANLFEFAEKNFLSKT
jgi:hypothetical protein